MEKTTTKYARKNTTKMAHQNGTYEETLKNTKTKSNNMDKPKQQDP